MKPSTTINLILFLCLVGASVFCLVYTLHEFYVAKETITAEIIDKWIDLGQGSVLTFKVELADHRIYNIGSFEYQRLELHKPYKIEVYRTDVKIIDERWRV